jgi:fructose-bisphosphate aldolase class II
MENLKHYLNKAIKEKWAIGQFNFSDFTQLKTIVLTAEKLKSPIILGTSEGESKFFGLEEAVAIRNVLRKKTGLPIFLNLDHGKSFEYVKNAIDAGYDMVHFDGSSLPLDENIKITKQVIKYAQNRGWFKEEVLVEGEVGKIGNETSKIYYEKVEIKEENLTKIKDVSKYIKETDVNFLAVSVGNFHGISNTGDAPEIKFDILNEVSKTVNKKVGLVLHGGSGILETDIKKAIELGIVKININTEIRKAFTEGLRMFLEQNSTEITPYKILPAVQPEIEKIIKEKINLFNSKDKL